MGKKYNIVSHTLVTVFEGVLSFIDDICLISYHQTIHFLWRPFLKDSNDDMVLEVAVNANVRAIITFNPKDFKGVKEQFGIDILTPKEYLIKVGALK